ncbi:hypothetical protein BSL78_29664, partial [Apostichopus japonicus]
MDNTGFFTMGKFTIHLTFFQVVQLVCASAVVGEGCENEQYLELYQPGIIQCSFEEGFLGVQWFNSTEEESSAFITYIKDEKDGPGFRSGDYDVWLNGSLFIGNVTVEHEGVFIVTHASLVSVHVKQYNIQVQLFVKPQLEYPVIEECQDKSKICYMLNKNPLELSCSVENVRPRISLIWNQRNSQRDKLLESNMTIIRNNEVTITPRSTVKIHNDSQLLSVLVCSINENTWILEENETLVILENGSVDISHSPIQRYVKLHSTMILPCHDFNKSILVWKRSTDRSEIPEVILIRVQTWKEDFNETYNKDFRLTPDGSLMLPRTELHHQGIYTCVASDYDMDRIQTIDVVMFTPERGITLECFIVEQNSDVFKSSIKAARIDLKVTYDNKGTSGSWTVAVVTTIIVVLLILVVLVVYLKVLNYRRSQRKIVEDEEMLPMTDRTPGKSDVQVLQAEGGKFIKELKAKYEILYHSVQPLPYIRDMYCVDNVYVDSGIERPFYLPKEFAPHTDRIRLTGFNEDIRDQYIRKAVVQGDEQAAREIILKLQRNPLLGDLCQVPLLFVLFAHMSHENKDLKTFKSVTSFFRNVIACFHSHLMNKTIEKITIACLHLTMAFKECDGYTILLQSGLSLWPLKTVEKIHIETEKEGKEPRTISEIQLTNIFRFALRCQSVKELSFSECLLPLSPSQESINAEMKSRKTKIYWREYGYSLNLYSGDWEVDNINIIESLCSERLQFWADDSQLQQNCTLQLLRNASNNGIPIFHLELLQSFSKANAGNIILCSGLQLSCPVSLKKLSIDTYEEGRELTETEVVGILMFAQQSQQFEELMFLFCLLPQCIAAEDIPSILKSRKVKVTWLPYDSGRSMTSTLNLVDG